MGPYSRVAKCRMAGWMNKGTFRCCVRTAMSHWCNGSEREEGEERKMRLIDADALKKDIKETHCTDCDNRNGVWCRACWVKVALAAIDSAPTIKAEPVRRGKFE